MLKVFSLQKVINKRINALVLSSMNLFALLSKRTELNSEKNTNLFREGCLSHPLQSDDFSSELK